MHIRKHYSYEHLRRIKPVHHEIHDVTTSFSLSMRISSINKSVSLLNFKINSKNTKIPSRWSTITSKKNKICMNIVYFSAAVHTRYREGEAADLSHPPLLRTSTAPRMRWPAVQIDHGHALQSMLVPFLWAHTWKSSNEDKLLLLVFDMETAAYSRIYRRPCCFYGRATCMQRCSSR
jgi:hypothetical protein